VRLAALFTAGVTWWLLFTRAARPSGLGCCAQEAAADERWHRPIPAREVKLGKSGLVTAAMTRVKFARGWAYRVLEGSTWKQQRMRTAAVGSATTQVLSLQIPVT